MPITSSDLLAYPSAARIPLTQDRLPPYPQLAVSSPTQGIVPCRGKAYHRHSDRTQHLKDGDWGIMHFLTGDLSTTSALVLIATAGLTSLLTAAVGAGGGTLLLAVMAQFLPPLAIIPVHGTVQLGSNLGRALLTRRHIDWPVIFAFLPGAVLAALAGSLVLVRLPAPLWYLSIALFVLYLCWGPPLPRRSLGPWGTAAAGAATTFISLFVGASGPLVAAFIKQLHRDRFRTVATFATAMSFQHGAKVLVFTQAGFAVQHWLGLIGLMIVSGVMGTWLGLRLLHHVRDRHFRGLFNLVLSLLALRLLWQAAAAWGLV